MSEQENIRLLGQQIKITVPGEPGERHSSHCIYQNIPELSAGQKYNGYAVCDIYHWSCTLSAIYIEVDSVLYQLNKWNCFKYPVDEYIEEVQQTVTFDKIRKIGLLLYNKLNEIEDELSKKVDRE